MPVPNRLLDLLACPVSAAELKESDGALVTADGKYHYPLVGGVPWLLPNPRNSLADWSAKLNHFNQVLLAEIKNLERALKHAEGATADRLQRLLNAKRAFIRRVSELLFPVVSATSASIDCYDALRDRAPHQQNLLSYEANLYRDWVWGDEENIMAADIVAGRLSGVTCDRLAVLGAGAGRLALDVHRFLSPKLTVATDINPLLVMAAEHLLAGKPLAISEFPLQPRKSEYVAVNHEIQIEKKPDDFFFAFADASKPSFKSAVFDVVLTPWLIDIQPLELGRFLRQLNQYLPVGGTWVNFGSLVFNQQRDALCYSVEEVIAVAKKQGFQIEDVHEDEIPYLKSPYNAGYRKERVWSWSAKKVEHVKRLNSPQVLPAWVLDDKQAIPSAAYIQQFVNTHRTYAQLAAEVDGKTSLAKISRKFARQHRMDEKEAEQLVKGFFIDLFQQNN